MQLSMLDRPTSMLKFRKKLLIVLITLSITAFPFLIITKINEVLWVDLSSSSSYSPSSSGPTDPGLDNEDGKCVCPVVQSSHLIEPNPSPVKVTTTERVRNNSLKNVKREFRGPFSIERSLKQEEENEKTFHKLLDSLNRIGGEGREADLIRFERLIEGEEDDRTWTLRKLLRQAFNDVKLQSEKSPHVNRPRTDKDPIPTPFKKTKINIASIACGKSRGQVMTMLKSAAIASQDVHLHAIVFSDKKTILDLGSDLLIFKWTTAELGWDLTFELHLESFPKDDGHHVKWREMWQPCSTQRLFFPSLLPHVDSVIFLDADTIVVSNLTQMWDKIGMEMKNRKLAGMASNTEYPAKGWYNMKSRVPHYGHGGLNAGVMLMNLTQMRLFNIEARSLASHTLYREKIYLADQDLYNIIFSAYPEKLLQISCTYNFNWVHCGDNVPRGICHLESRPGSTCFCHDAMRTGLHIVHGNCKTFYPGKRRNYPFIIELHRQFQKLNILEDSILDMIQELKDHFDTLTTPCFALTSKVLYKNLETYLQKLYL